MDETELVFHDKATDSRMAGLVLVVLSAGVFFVVGEDGWPVLIFGAVGLFIFLFISNLTIIASRSTQTLRLEYRSVLSRSVKEIPFAEIDAIDVEQNKRRRRRRTYIVYRIIVTQKDGRVIPFRPYYSSAFSEKAGQVNALRAIMGHGDAYWQGKQKPDSL